MERLWGIAGIELFILIQCLGYIISFLLLIKSKMLRRNWGSLMVFPYFLIYRCLQRSSLQKKLELLSCLRIGHPHLTQGYLWSTSVTQFLLIENVIWQCRVNTGHEPILDKHSSESWTFSVYSVLKFLQRYKTIRNRWVGRFGLASVLWTFFNNKHMWDNIDQKCLLISCYMVQM